MLSIREHLARNFPKVNMRNVHALLLCTNYILCHEENANNNNNFITIEAPTSDQSLVIEFI